MAGKRKARELTVTSAVQLTQNMRRLTLQGEDLSGLPADAEGAYFKLVFAGANPDKPVMRTYTVARFRPEKNEIDVDFMLHTKADGTATGVAAPWAVQANHGDAISIFGPSTATFINTDADWYLLAADMAALPAMTANLARLPVGATGYVIVEILSELDKQNLPIPAGMEIIWVVNEQPGSDLSPLYSAIKEVRWLEGQVAVWVACEFTTMKKIRAYLKDDRQIEKSHLYVSSYWKKGLQEEEHKVAKREDAA